MILITLILLVVGFITRNDMIILTSGLYAIASAIDIFATKYFKGK